MYFLVMAGTHGASGFEEFWIGSNANRIVSALRKPVITIRGGVNINRNLEKIVLPLDSTPETRQKVPFTAYMAKIFNAEVHILRVYTSKVLAIIRKDRQLCRTGGRNTWKKKISVMCLSR